jgi:hypothetical protein
MPRVACAQDQKERSGVHRAVIGRLGDLMEVSHLPHAQLMHDLARLLVPPRISLLALIMGKKT